MEAIPAGTDGNNGTDLPDFKTENIQFSVFFFFITMSVRLQKTPGKHSDHQEKTLSTLRPLSKAEFAQGTCFHTIVLPVHSLKHLYHAGKSGEVPASGYARSPAAHKAFQLFHVFVCCDLPPGHQGKTLLPAGGQFR